MTTDQDSIRTTNNELQMKQNKSDQFISIAKHQKNNFNF